MRLLLKVRPSKWVHIHVCIQYVCTLLVSIWHTFMFVYKVHLYLSVLQVDRQESAREQKRAEVLDSMKRLFPGVVSYDYLV